MEENNSGGEPKFRQIINDFQHFLIIRGDNHKFMEHLFSERLKVEAELLEKLETEIEQLKLLTLKSCPNCGVRRPKRYHRSSQTTRTKPTTTIIAPSLITPKNRQPNQETNLYHQPSSQDLAKFRQGSLVQDKEIEDRLEKLTAKVDQVSSKTLEDLATYGQG